MKFRLTSELIIYINSFGEHTFTKINAVNIPLLKLDAGNYEVECYRYGSAVIRFLVNGEYLVIPCNIFDDVKKQSEFILTENDLDNVSIPNNVKDLTKEFNRKVFENTINKATLIELREIAMLMYDRHISTEDALKAMIEAGWV